MQKTQTHTDTPIHAILPVGVVIVVRFLFQFQAFHCNFATYAMIWERYAVHDIWNFSCLVVVVVVFVLILDTAVAVAACSCLCVCVCCCFEIFKRNTKHTTHRIILRALIFYFSFCDSSLCLSLSANVSVFVWQLCNHFIRTDFIFIVACCLPFYLLFCVSCFVRLLLFFTCRLLCFSLENFFTIVCFLLWNFIVYKTFSFDFFASFRRVSVCMLYEKCIYIYIVYVNKQFTHSTSIRFAPIASYCCVCMCLSACMLFYHCSGMGHFSQLCLLWSHTHIHKRSHTGEYVLHKIETVWLVLFLF